MSFVSAKRVILYGISGIMLYTAIQEHLSRNPMQTPKWNVQLIGERLQKVKKNFNQHFLRDQRSNFRRAWLSPTSSNEAIQYTMWKLILRALRWCNSLFEMKNGKLMRVWMITGIAKMAKSREFRSHTSNEGKIPSGYYYGLPTFRPILRGHVWNFGKLIWNYPYINLHVL